MKHRSNTILYGMIICPLFCLVLMRKEKAETWHIEYVLMEMDTLYYRGNCVATYNFYNQKMGKIQKNQSDINYINSCMRSTCHEFRNAELVFNKNEYKLSTIKPCWDEIKINGTKDGMFTKNEREIQLLNDNINLSINREESTLTYSNTNDNYQIVFKKR